MASISTLAGDKCLNHALCNAQKCVHTSNKSKHHP